VTPVSAARACAFEVVRDVFERGAYADHSFRAHAERHGLDARDRAFAMRVAYGTVQRKATLDYLIEQLTDRPLARLDPPVLASLRVGLYQLLYLEGVPDHAAVDESVELAKSHAGGGHALVNAALRRATREGRTMVEAIGDADPEQAALRYSHPRWIAELWWDMLGREEALRLMKRDNEPAESAVRANTLRTDAAELAAQLARDGIRSRIDAIVPEAVVIEEPYDVHGSPPFEQGLLMPQSRGSMLVAHAVDPSPGESVLDLCAAPGAKTTHLAALMRDEGQVVALDLDDRRVRSIAGNCERLAARCVEARQGDAARARFPSAFDRVLVDPPCSDLGTLQSRPDARWRKQPRQVAGLSGLQRRILDAAADSVRAGGRLVYSTCTISPVENELQIDDFLRRRPEFSVVDLSPLYPEASSRSRNGFLQTLPHRHETDGFFIAALERTQ
jgi:16S rRNA (cytosine967-C5)-methyltransferase